LSTPDPREILTPSSLNRLVRQLLDDAMPPVWVEGELSNVARPASGHLYFTLKDAGAQIRCAMFRTAATRLRFRAGDGLHVRLRGRVGLYEPRGDYQLIVDAMEEAGEGALQRAYEALKARLAAEGVFNSARKQPLPAFPKRLAVITSPSGAAIRDVLTVIARRFPLLPVDILPSPVQGAEAVPVLRAQLRAAIAAGRHDVILITRGGGSLEDLWAFNDEGLARDIAASPVPIVAAIGHEVDVTLAELAADLRAPTPSAAAESIAPDGAQLARQLRLLGQRLRRDTTRHLQGLAQRLDSARLRLQSRDPRRQLEHMRERALAARQRLLLAMRNGLANRRGRLATSATALRSQAPAAAAGRPTPSPRCDPAAAPAAAAA
jgi:exodeoxyribonuclease VII large subunit